MPLISLNMKFTKTFFTVGFLCFLLFGFSRDAWALTCNDQADGNWNSSATWSCGVIPDADDDVTIDSNTVTMTADALSDSVVVSGGTFNMGSYTLSNDTNWTYSSGSLNTDTSTLKFVNSTGTTFVPGSADYYNIEIAKSGSGDTTLNSAVTVTNDFTISNGDTTSHLYGTGTWNVEGDLQVTDSDVAMSGAGTAFIVLNGSGDQTISSSGGTVPYIEVDKASGTLSISGTFSVIKGWTYTAGDMNIGTSTLKFVSSGNVAISGGSITYYNVEFAKSGEDYIVSGDLNVGNDFTVSAGDNSIDIMGGTINVHGNADISAGYKADGQTGTVKFIGTGDQTISSSGGGNYPNIVIDKSSGTLNMNGSIVTSQSWTLTNGTVNAGTSTLKFNGASNTTFTGGGASYYNVEIASGTNTDFSLPANVIVSNDLVISSGGTGADLFGSSFEVGGDVLVTATIYGGSGDHTGKIILNGTGDQTISSAGGELPGVEVNKPSGVVSLQGTIPVQLDWNWLSGELNAGSSTLQLMAENSRSFRSGGGLYNNVEIAKDNVSDVVTLLDDLNVHGNLTVTQGTFTTGADKKIVGGNFSQVAGTVNLSNSVIKVFKNFTHSGGTFNAGTSTISLAGKNQTVTGSTTFYKLYKLVDDADTLTIGATSNLTVGSGGMMRLRGADGASNKLALRSSTPSTAYTITTTGSINMENLDVQDMALSAAQSASSSLDSGGNTNLTITKEFISTIRSSGGDYSSLSAWESANNVDLTASSTKVFAHGGGSLGDGQVVTGSISGATATVVHATSSQVLLSSISGTFQSGDVLGGSVTLSDAGYGAVSVAECYNDWASGLSDQLVIDGWTTDVDNYVKVYTPKSERHSGTKGTGFRTITTGTAISSTESYTKIRGIEMNGNNGSNARGVSLSGQFSEVSGNLLYDFGDNHSGGIYHAGYSNIFNNLVFNVLGDSHAISSNAANERSYLYNNTVIGSAGVGIDQQAHADSVGKNNLSVGSGGSDYNGEITKYNCVSSDDTAGYTNGNLSGQKIDFASRLENDYHLSIDDITANNRGLDLSVDPDFPIISDIDGDRRTYDDPLGEKWDIGADQNSNGFISKIRASGGDYTTLTLWETANQVDLTADDTLVFSHIEGLKNGLISDGITVVGETSGTTATAVHVSEGQILLSGITLSGSDANFAFLPGEKVYIQGGVTTSDYIILSNNPPTTASSVAECYNDWPSGLDDQIAIDGWDTDGRRYVKIYTPEGQRHDGVDYDSGFWMLESGGWDSSIELVEQYTRIEGIAFNPEGQGSNGISFASQGAGNNAFIDSCIFYANTLSYAADGIEYGTGSGITKNSIAVKMDVGFYGTGYNSDNYIFNSSAYECDDGFVQGSEGGETILKNNVSFNNVSSNWGTVANWHADSSNNAADSSSEGLIPGSNSTVSISDNDFVDTTSYDFHLSKDSKLRGMGVETSELVMDIDGQFRDIDASGWDVGPDEALPDSISKIREATQSDADFSTLSSWESALDSNLTATSSMVFPVSSVGSFDKATDLDQAVTFASGAIGTLKMLNSSDVAYITDISGTVERGYVTVDSNAHVFGIANEGERVGRAVAECYNDWGVSGLSDRLNIDGWTVDSEHYVKVYAPEGQRHTGVAGTGFHFNANYSYAIYTNSYAEIDGLEISGWGWSSGTRPGLSSGHYVTARNNIVHDPDDNSGAYIGIEAGQYWNVYNNIVYNIDKPSASSAVGITGFRNNLIYNNTVYNSRRGIVRTEDEQDDIFINNISFGNSVEDYYITAAATSPSSDKNLSSDGTANGTNPITDVTLAQIGFKSTTSGSEDLHISSSSVAVSAGSNTVFSLVDKDIDGDVRLSSSIDIGADQVPMPIYRSVGPGNTNVLQNGIGTGIPNNMTISGTTATFGDDIDNDIGVGDVIQYDSSDDGSIDSIAFIYARNSSTSYTVKNAEGLTPTATSVADSDWEIFRAYTSLANAESGNENDGIDDSLENFDDWTTGGGVDDDEVGKDLVSANQAWLVACYADAMDSQAVDIIIDGWTTSEDQYLEFFTPVTTSEVGESQRHEGKWDATKYVFTTSRPRDAIRLTIRDSFVILNGLQLLGNSSLASNGNILHIDNADSDAIVQVKNSILKNAYHYAANLSSTNTGKLIIANSVLDTSYNGVVGDSSNLDELQVYNSTLVRSLEYSSGSTYGVRNALARNVVSMNYGGGTGYYNFMNLHANSSNCVANYQDMSGITDSFETTQSTVQFFQDPENGDYHLKEISEAIGKGVSLGSAYALDFEGDVRTRWDVGADEMFKPNYEMRGNVKFRGNVKLR